MRYRKWIFALCLGMVMAGLAGCGKSESDQSGTEIMGRVTAVSDSEITLAVFERQDGEKPDGSEPDGGNPDGERPDGENPDGSEPDGEKPDGEKPDSSESDDKKPDGEKPDGERPQGGRPGNVSGGAFRAGEEPPASSGQPANEQTKKIAISGDTKVYRQQGEEKTEGTISDIQLGSMVSVVMEGEEAVSITIQTMEERGRGRGNRTKDNATVSQ